MKVWVTNFGAQIDLAALTPNKTGFYKIAPLSALNGADVKNMLPTITRLQIILRRLSSVVVREAGCYIKGPGFEPRVRHGCQSVRPWSHQWLSSSAFKNW